MLVVLYAVIGEKEKGVGYMYGMFLCALLLGSTFMFGLHTKKL